MGCVKQSKDRPAELERRLDHMQSNSMQSVREKYIFERIVGRGHYGAVHLVSLHSDPKQTFAIKAISKKKVKAFRAMAEREVSILHSLDHPNILKLVEVSEDSRSIYLVTEYCAGGSLLTWLQRTGLHTEQQVAYIMHKVFKGIHHLHQHQICHRDLKPENFMFTSNSPDAELKIIDFGLSARFRQKDGISEMKSIVGTPSYQSPEVLQGKYGPKCDMWSAGVVLYTLLSADAPFTSTSSSKEAFQRILQGQYSMTSDLWQGVSPQAQDLISKLLILDPNKRLEPEAALQHPWFSLYPPKPPAIDFEVANTIQNCRNWNTFQRITLKIITKYIKSEDITPLTETFNALDGMNSGFVTISRLKTGLNDVNLNVSAKSLSQIKKFASIRGNKLSYSDFLAVSLDSHGLLSYERLHSAFLYYDLDQKGVITSSDILSSLHRQEKNLDSKDMKRVSREVQVYSEGLGFEGFREVFRQ